MLTTRFSGCLFLTRHFGPNQVRRSVARLLGLAAVAIVFLSPSPAGAATYYWQTSSGDWSQAANWGGVAPTANDAVIIDNNGTATVTEPGPACSTLWLGDTTGSGNVQLVAGGALSTGNQFVGYSGTGGFNQSGGTNSIGSSLYLGYNSAASGSYGLTGGLVSSEFQYIGYAGTGNFAQSGGVNFSWNGIYLGYNTGASGSYTLTGSGSLSTEGARYVGYSGTAVFAQTGGNNSLTNNNLYLGNNAGSSGLYALSGTGQLSAVSEIVGNAGTGLFTQSGGTNAVSDTLYVGYTSGGGGIYSLSGSGQLTAGTELIGCDPATRHSCSSPAARTPRRT